ncbi:hypothetical protein ACIQWR_18935 [Streptomyces sp. NPDC098789]|uniref:hypothetical protein n=1 Tax=Streptomyces sp. NPDC098789 TaxID=3366098 RepID=UPI003804FA83
METAAENVVLVESLRAAVPLHMMQLGSHSPEELVRIAGESATVVGSQGDVLQFRSTKRGQTAKAFNALARGLAAGALLARGGATFAGLHWCTVPHCPGPDAEHPEPTHGETHA